MHRFLNVEIRSFFTTGSIMPTNWCGDRIMTSFVHASGFSGAYSGLNGRFRIHARHLDLSRSLVTVGYLNQHHARWVVGPWRAKLMRALCWGYLDQSLRTTEYFGNLEQSEKVGVSFLLGQAFTHWYAQQHMNLQYLLHVSGLHSYRVATTPATNGIKSGAAMTRNGSRPDFIGFASNEYHVFESKGRVRNPSAADKATALGQASRIDTVNGQAATTRCATFLVLKATGVQGQVLDPAPTKNALAIRFDDIESLTAAYAVFLGRVGQLYPLDRYGGDGFVGLEIDDEVYFGIDRKVIDAMTYEPVRSRMPREDLAPSILRMLAERRDYYRSRNEHDISVGPDGLMLLDRSRDARSLL